MELDLAAIKQEGTPCPIALRGGDRSKAGDVYTKQFSGATRVARGARTGAIFLFVTVLMAALPVAHFVLVPLGLIATCIFGAASMGTKSIILGGVGQCPYCEKEFRIFKRANRFPFSDVCEACHRQVKIERDAALGKN